MRNLLKYPVLAGKKELNIIDFTSACIIANDNNPRALAKKMYEKMPDCQGARVEAYLNPETAEVELHAFESHNSFMSSEAELMPLFDMYYINKSTYSDEYLCLEEDYTAQDLEDAMLNCWIDYAQYSWESRDISAEIQVYYTDNFHHEDLEGERVYSDPKALRLVEIDLKEGTVTVDNDYARACSLEEAGLGGLETASEMLDKKHEDLVVGDSPLKVVFGFGKKGGASPVHCELKDERRIHGQVKVDIIVRKELVEENVYLLQDLCAEIDLEGGRYSLAPCFWGEMLERKFRYNGFYLVEI